MIEIFDISIPEAQHWWIQRFYTRNIYLQCIYLFAFEYLFAVLRKYAYLRNTAPLRKERYTFFQVHRIPRVIDFHTFYMTFLSNSR